jgi:hypothetical protein
MRGMARNSLASVACLLATRALAQGSGDQNFYLGVDAAGANGLHITKDGYATVITVGARWFF